MGLLISLINLVITVLIWIIVIDAVLSFFPNVDRRNPIVVLIKSITEPMYRPIRKIVPTVRMGDAGLDLSPIIVIIALQIIGSLLIRIL